MATNLLDGYELLVPKLGHDENDVVMVETVVVAVVTDDKVADTEVAALVVGCCVVDSVALLASRSRSRRSFCSCCLR